MSKNMFIVSILIGLMIGIAFGSTNAKAGLALDNLRPCMKKIFKHNFAGSGQIVGVSCQFFEEPSDAFTACLCYELVDEDDFNVFFPSNCNSGECACDGYKDHFRSLRSFTCLNIVSPSLGFTQHATAIWYGPWIVGGTGISFGPTTSTFPLCRPDSNCQTTCETACIGG